MKTKITQELKTNLQTQLTIIRDQHRATIDDMLENGQITMGEWLS